MIIVRPNPVPGKPHINRPIFIDGLRGRAYECRMAGTKMGFGWTPEEAFKDWLAWNKLGQK